MMRMMMMTLILVISAICCRHSTWFSTSISPTHRCGNTLDLNVSFTDRAPVASKQTYLQGLDPFLLVPLD